MAILAEASEKGAVLATLELNHMETTQLKKDRFESARVLLFKSLFTNLCGVTAGDWFTILRRHGLSIAPSVWPRAAVVSVGSVLNSWYKWREDRAFAEQVASTAIRPPVFILGHWRSGTTLLHNLLALVGSHRLSAAHELVSALKTSAVSANTDQCQVSKIIGVDLAETILDMAEQRQSRVPLASLATRLPRLGGSVAQRDVFLRTLLLIAAESGDQVSTAKLKALRLRQRREDNFVRLVDRRGHTGQNLAQSIACA